LFADQKNGRNCSARKPYADGGASGGHRLTRRLPALRKGALRLPLK
jgi:hypothetical protein